MEAHLTRKRIEKEYETAMQTFYSLTGINRGKILLSNTEIRRFEEAAKTMYEAGFNAGLSQEDKNSKVALRAVLHPTYVNNIRAIAAGYEGGMPLEFENTLLATPEEIQKTPQKSLDAEVLEEFFNPSDF